ncbi:zinc-dependent alcohol dehydrogenase [Antarcticirhabdus aurantiaca]|uniref:zinc-dependent alcohol dehydrogenase n=1 Tax=Antarcticirhabdus aurantiaca TaxID=2606717 RepID=UPI00131CA770|nr:zinc-binding alcohol dehydrogenase [Antarcticirhabdus aurantiaca]
MSDEPRRHEATALWIEAAGRAALRRERLREPKDGECRVATRFGAISRGTERLVFQGRVPADQHEAMRAPFQAGGFDFPLKYGYASVGLVEAGPAALIGRTVFCLHPHQDRFVVPSEALHLVPEGLPAERAVLAANMETALTIVWDAGLQLGDRLAVIGAGMVGALVAALAAGIPGTEVTLVDVASGRERLAAALGIGFAAPGEAPTDCDVAVHVSGSAGGLDTAIACLGFEGRAVEASWYGTAPVELRLGGAFHSKRLSILGSQVGAVPPARRARWSTARRLDLALRLLRDRPELDALVSGESDFASLAHDYAAVLDAPDTLCHRIRY